MVMEVKLFEVRDRATLIPVMGIALVAGTTADLRLLEWAGYAREQILPFLPKVILIRLDGDAIEAQNDPYAWRGVGRTLPAAHQHLIDKWSGLESGDVVDVEFILGERPEPKRSERRE